MVPLKSQELYFELPESPIRGFPLYSSVEIPLHLGFVEVGCRSRKKQEQLKEKRQLFYKYWGDKYRKIVGKEWLPPVYRTLVHYNSSVKVELGPRRSGLDAVITYLFISSELLTELNSEDKKKIYQSINDVKDLAILEDILETKDAERLYRIVTGKNALLQRSAFRGKIAEIMAMKDMNRALSPGMNLFQNININYFNKKYLKGTEVDAILLFYGEEPYVTLMEELRKLDHLKVKDRSH